ncbi:replication protein A 70 kDa DNA-binding subunit [Trifolium repens]|nr:replication protein A 70 kDa DNA-binding subunit [Trifolium repens]
MVGLSFFVLLARIWVLTRANLLLGKVNMRIKVRVIHLWKVPAFLKPSEYSSLEFVWVDEKGGKIHASIRKQLVNVFESKVEEGEVYESKIVALIHSSKPHIYYSTVFFGV